jgi:hypothetical protein
MDRRAKTQLVDLTDVQGNGSIGVHGGDARGTLYFGELSLSAVMAWGEGSFGKRRYGGCGGPRRPDTHCAIELSRLCVLTQRMSEHRTKPYPGPDVIASPVHSPLVRPHPGEATPRCRVNSSTRPRALLDLLKTVVLVMEAGEWMSNPKRKRERWTKRRRRRRTLLGTSLRSRGTRRG